MGRITPTQNNFSAGEWAPSLYGRTDLNKYTSACRTMKNWLIHAHGGATTRPGTYCVGSVDNSENVARLIPFQFSATDNYILSFGDESMQVIKGEDFVTTWAHDGFDEYVLSNLQSIGTTVRGTERFAGNGNLYVEGTSSAQLIDVNDTVSNVATIVSNGNVTAFGTEALPPPKLIKNVVGDFFLGCRCSFSGTPANYTRCGVCAREMETPADHQMMMALKRDQSGDYYHSAWMTGESETTVATTNGNYFYGIKRVGDVFTLYYSTVSYGVSWTQAVQYTVTNAKDVWQVGIFLSSPSVYYPPNPGDTGLYTSIFDFASSVGMEDSVCRYITATPYAASDLAAINYSQTADIMYMTHEDYAEQKLIRSADDEWEFSTITHTPGQTSPTNLALSVGTGTTHNYVVSAVSDAGEESYPTDPQEADHDDTLSWDPPSTGDAPAYYSIYKDKDKATGLYGWVADVVNTTWVVQNIDPDMEYCALDDGTTMYGIGNPRACAFFEQRMTYGGFADLPNTILGSRIGFYDNFTSSHTITDDAPYEFTLDSRQLNLILWMLPLDRLLIGTAGSEWRMEGGSASDTITPTSVNVRLQSEWGSAPIMPLVVGDTVLYVQYGGKNIRELAYSLENDRYVGRDLTILSSHLFQDRSISEWCHQRTPDSIVWVVCNDGTLLGLTYLKEQEVWAWHQHETDGTVENCCVIPAGDGTDILYLVVNRTINGSAVRCIETMQDIERDDPRLAWNLDCARQINDQLPITSFSYVSKQFVSVGHGLTTDDYIKFYDLEGQFGDLEGVILKVTVVDANIFTVTHKVGITWTAYTDAEWDEMNAADYVSGGCFRKLFTTISGLDYLEGETVTALADGFVCTDLTVSAGAVTLPIQAGIATVGLPYTCDLETLDFIVANQTQTVADKLRRIVGALVQLFAARSMHIGPDADRLLNVPFRTTEGLDKPVAFFSGAKKITFLPGDSDSSRIFIRVSEPLPTTVLSLVPRVDVGGE